MNSRLFGSLVLSVGALACGSNNNDDHDGAVDANVAADAPKSIDAPAQIGAGVVAIPLTADGGGYTAKMSIGAQPFDVIVDTGSSSTGVAAASCTNCNAHPGYTPGGNAMDLHMAVSSQYGSGSWKGEAFRDGAAMGSLPSVSLDFASITTQTGFFQPGAGYTGILGLGPDGLLLPGTTSYLSSLIASGMTGQLSFQMCPDGGTMWLGGYDPAKAMGALAFTPQNTQIPYYIVNVATAVTGGSSLTGTDFGPTIIDTGTTVTFVPKAIVTSMMNAVKASPSYSAVFGSQVLSPPTGQQPVCLSSAMTGAQVDAALPPFQLTFAGGTSALEIPATQSYLYNQGDGTFCFVFMDSSQLFGGQKVSLFGNTLLGGLITVFDITNKQLGFALQKGCNEGPVAPHRLVVRQPSDALRAAGGTLHE